MNAGAKLPYWNMDMELQGHIINNQSHRLFCLSQIFVPKKNILLQKFCWKKNILSKNFESPQPVQNL